MRSRSQAPPPSTCGVRVQLVGGAGHEEAALAVEALLHQGLEEVLEEAASILRRGERGKGEREVKGPGGGGGTEEGGPSSEEGGTRPLLSLSSLSPPLPHSPHTPSPHSASTHTPPHPPRPPLLRRARQ